MRRTAVRQYEMFVRVYDFGEAHRTLFAGSSVAEEALAAIAKAVAQVQEHTGLMLPTREGTSAKQKAREALEERLAAIGRTARVIAEQTPGFDDAFRRPHRRQLDQALLISGRVAITGAEQAEHQFISRGMPPTFVAELRELVAGFERAMRGRESVKARRAGANAALRVALASGFAALRTLDIVVHNLGRQHADPATLAVWQHARRVDYPRRSKKAINAPLSVRVVSVSPIPERAALPMPSVALQTEWRQ